MRTVTPTRHNLYATVERIDIAERGANVLRRRLDGLIMTFMDVFDRYESARDRLDDAYETAASTFALVRAMEGEISLDGIVRSRHPHPVLTLSSRNVMGTDILQIEASSIGSDLSDRGYGLIGTSPVVDDLVEAYERLLERLVVVAEVTAALRRLLTDIETTKRRVNAIEKAVLPRLRADRTYIERHLEEREREERIRQKWIKNKRDRERRHESFTS